MNFILSGSCKLSAENESWQPTSNLIRCPWCLRNWAGRMPWPKDFIYSHKWKCFSKQNHILMLDKVAIVKFIWLNPWFKTSFRWNWSFNNQITKPFQRLREILNQWLLYANFALKTTGTDFKQFLIWQKYTLDFLWTSINLYALINL